MSSENELSTGLSSSAAKSDAASPRTCGSVGSPSTLRSTPAPIETYVVASETAISDR
jgi:hypothetical protein